MRVILSAIIAAVVLGIAAGAILWEAQRPAYEVFATSGTRVDDPGYNLVGHNWSGLNSGRDAEHDTPHTPSAEGAAK